MSTINKKAFISKVLESLTSEQLTTLKGLVNGSTEPTFKSLINSTYGITNSDKGVKHIILETQKKTLSGYLIYNNTYCMMISYALNTQELSMFHILLNDKKVKTVSEYLDIDELRTLLDDSLIDGKVEALSSTGLKREVVEALPTGSAIQSNVIYLVQDITGDSGNIYNEYMYINDGWELLGTTATSGGSSIEVVELPNQASGTLTDAEYAKISGDNCIVIMKPNSTSANIFYRAKVENNIYIYKTIFTVDNITNNNSILRFREFTVTFYSDKTWSRFNNSEDINVVKPNQNIASAVNILQTLQVGSTNYRILPAYPSTTGTYVLKLVNGTLTWVQE